MNLTFQEKVNLSFLSMYEKLNEMYKNVFFRIIDDIYCGKINNDEIDEQIRKDLKENYGDREKLKDKHRFEILVKTNLISQEENDLRYELSTLRDKIAHSPGTIFYNEMTLEKFKIKKMITLYQNLVAKICNFVLFNACKTKEQQEDVFKKIYLTPIAGIKLMAEELFSNDKFNEIKDMFDKRIIIND